MRAIPGGTATAVVAVMAGALILPRVLINYGQSGDALDNARDAARLVVHGLTDGVPLMIRWPPGVPLLTYLLALVVPWGGHIASNVLVSGFYVLSVIAFRGIVRADGNAVLLTGLFALTPMIVKNASVTQDFVPGLACVLLAFWACGARQTLLTGLFVGLAVGFRITNILMLAALAVYMAFDQRDVTAWARGRRIGAASIVGLGLGLSFYSPFVWLSGMGWRYFVPLPQVGTSFGTLHWRLVAYNLAYMFGPIALLGIGVLMWWHRGRIGTAVAIDVRARSAVLFAAMAMIVLYLMLCVRFTMKPEYFMPAIPFVYLLFARWFPRRALVIILVLVVSYSVVSIELKGGPSGKRVLSVRPAWGLVVEDWHDRRDVEALRQGVGRLRVLRRAVVLTGMGGMLTYDNEWLQPIHAGALSPSLDPRAAVGVHRGGDSMIHALRGGERVFLVYSLSRESIERLRGEGYQLYMFSEHAPSATVAVHGYDPYALGIEVLPIRGVRAFYRERAS